MNNQLNMYKKIIFIIFISCLISCNIKKKQDLEFNNTEENNISLTQDEENVIDNNIEEDNFQGYYIFTTIDILEQENIDISKYIDLDETIYIKLTKNNELEKYNYIMESNFWLLEDRLQKRPELYYPNERLNMFNYNTIFVDRFLQIAADGSRGGFFTDFFRIENGIALHHISEYKRESGIEKIECYIFFNKVSQ